MIAFRKRFQALVLVYVVVLSTLVVGTTACPFDKKSIDDFAKASRELAADVNLAIDTTAILFQNGKISLELKDKLARGYKEVSTHGREFHALVERLAQQEAEGTLPSNAIQLLRQNWVTVFNTFRSVKALFTEANDANAVDELNAASEDLEKDVNYIDGQLKKAQKWSSLKK